MCEQNVIHTFTKLSKNELLIFFALINQLILATLCTHFLYSSKGFQYSSTFFSEVYFHLYFMPCIISQGPDILEMILFPFQG